ncbi:kinesin-like calmodulin-binding protein, putative [Ichthyophthirius multifiliis]|uniref:Kinesin-like protein n=1 Tax=Ichthyophthirius multifiliis TaxID=5932 RepID=G0QWS4_ICHMU|nr:kinesin-like calmodulin-binding protein, putative [Ichthyophthirius multifiliis]EGR30329.1 kinesin-like calmodulin-binding protein, putative [Ichthyophthirius multifiliis]|eukprot:XP_004031916.1 kinesin-like calmodulin-binding protein, putative [Ichthyophthirius multifiliis]
MKGQIRVFCRVRPLSEIENNQQNNNICVEIQDEMNIQIKTRNGLKKFSFDSCFGQNSTQDNVFQDVKNLIQSVLDGYNVCVFAYGQTGSGKTFTMYGTQENPGITPRAINELYNLIQNMSQLNNIIVKVHLVELYTDNIIDLLDNNHLKKIEIKEDYINNSIYLQNVKIIEATSSEHLLNIIKQGFSKRKVSKTDMNVESSRSHIITIIEIQIKNKKSQEILYGKLTLVDLAGSERINKSNSNQLQIKEALHINKSLTSLGDVIEALATQNLQGGEKHIPYRNNKLTYLMKDSLGGNVKLYIKNQIKQKKAKTLMFVNISPSEFNQEESQSSLQYGSRVKSIVNDPSKNIETKEFIKIKEKLQLMIQENQRLQSSYQQLIQQQKNEKYNILIKNNQENEELKSNKIKQENELILRLKNSIIQPKIQIKTQEQKQKIIKISEKSLSLQSSQIQQEKLTKQTQQQMQNSQEKQQSQNFYSNQNSILQQLLQSNSTNLYTQNKNNFFQNQNNNTISTENEHSIFIIDSQFQLSQIQNNNDNSNYNTNVFTQKFLNKNNNNLSHSISTQNNLSNILFSQKRKSNNSIFHNKNYNII